MKRFLRAAIAAIGIGLPALAVADEPLAPMMDPNHPVQCARDTKGDGWRMQCDETSKVCLYTPDVELDADGNRIDKPLERVRDCAVDQPFDPVLIRRHAVRFSRARFGDEMEALVQAC